MTRHERIASVAIMLFALLMILAMLFTVYITSGPLFTFNPDGTYCMFEGTPLEECEQREGWQDQPLVPQGATNNA